MLEQFVNPLSLFYYLPILGLRDALQGRQSVVLPQGSYKGQVVCVTGSTTGIGLAAAIHFVNLGADEVIVTYRDRLRGEAAKERIRAATKGRECQITLLELDMDRFASVVAFVNELKKVRVGTGGIDYLALNAGIYPSDPNARSSEDWPQALQVNTLSNLLIALLLLPHMMAERRNRMNTAHIGFVSSIAHIAPAISHSWSKWADREGILAHYRPQLSRKKWNSYCLSKLMLTFLTRELANRVIGKDGRPSVIINTMCPGVVITGIFQTRQSRSKKRTSYMELILHMIGKSPEDGAGIIVLTGLTTDEETGQFTARYVPKAWKKQVCERHTGETGKRIQARLWQETINVLVASVPQVNEAVIKLGK